MSLDDGGMFGSRADDAVSAPRCFSVGAIAISEERNEMRTQASRLGVGVRASERARARATSCWTISIADHHRRRSDDGNDDGDREEHRRGRERASERAGEQPR